MGGQVSSSILSRHCERSAAIHEEIGYQRIGCVLEEIMIPTGRSFRVTTTGSRRAESRNLPKGFLASRADMIFMALSQCCSLSPCAVRPELVEGQPCPLMKPLFFGIPQGGAVVGGPSSGRCRGGCDGA